MKAYHNKPELKQMMVEEAIKHREQDMLLRGTYYREDKDGKFRGCAVGCTIHSLNVRLGLKLACNNHGAYETELGIPKELAQIEDGIFEQLPEDESLTWPQRFLEAPPVGSDLSGVVDKFMHWLLVDPKNGIIKFANKVATRLAIQNVADLYAKKIAGETVTAEHLRMAAAAAYAADASAAYAYAAAAYTAAAAAYIAANTDAFAYAAAAAAAYIAANTDAFAYAAAAAADAADAAAAAAAAAAYAAAAAAAYAAAAAAAYAAAAAAYAAAAAAKKESRVQQSVKLLELMADAPASGLLASTNFKK